MVWAAISKSCRSPLIFVDPGAKINAKCYVDNILKPMLEYAKDHFVDIPTRWCNVTQNWCRDHIPNFWSKEMWPPRSLDLNSMDFLVWSILETKACKKIHHTVDDLKRSLRRAWNETSQEQLHAASEGVRKRLEAVIECNGGHFE